MAKVSTHLNIWPSFWSAERNLKQGARQVQDVVLGQGDAIPLELVSGRQSILGRREDLNLEDRIIQDLTNNDYECTICTDTIGINTKPGLWQCNHCFSVWHHRCIFDWALTNEDRSGWRCPICSTLRLRFPKATCWCGSHTIDTPGNLSLDKPNSCGKVCHDLAGRCCSAKRRRCQKICHPGRCDNPSCDPSCSREQRRIAKTERRASAFRPVTPPPTVLHSPVSTLAAPRTATTGPLPAQNPQRGRKCSKIIHQNCGILLCLLILTPCLIVGYVKHGYWTSKPYIYGTDDMKFYKNEKTAAMFITASATMMLFFCGTLNLIVKFTRAPQGYYGRNCSNFILFVFWFLVAVFWAIGPVIGLFTAPRRAWQKQMDGTCKGFETMFNFDTYPFVQDPNEPNEEIIITTRIASTWIATMDLTSVLTPYTWHSMANEQSHNSTSSNQTLGNEKHFESTYYHYSSNLTSQRNVPYSLYIDLANHSYKFCTPSRTSRRALFTSHGPPPSKVENPQDISERWCPSIPKPSSTMSPIKAQIKPVTDPSCAYGNWTATSKEQPHLRLPSLDLQIPYFRNFTQNCVYEPFLQIYSMRNKTSEQIRDQVRRMWTKESGVDEVGRTASFGAKQGALSMCVRREASQSKDWVLEKEEERILVPMGIVAAMRAQWRNETGPQRGFC